MLSASYYNQELSIFQGPFGKVPLVDLVDVIIRFLRSDMVS
jgi:hypothetical protein